MVGTTVEVTTPAVVGPEAGETVAGEEAVTAEVEGSNPLK
ncbi:hypothetical protein BH18ACT10_BH18ACT10_13590 [soil metagenome]